MSEKNHIFIISGPSGAGEDSIINGLAKKFELERVITTTTREMRPGESNGSPYYFISQAEFEEKIKQAEFAEYAEEYNGKFYGVTKQELERVQQSGKIGIWKIEYKGVIFVKKTWPHIPAIFIMADNLEVLAKRIRKRDHVSEEYIKERMDYTKEWLKNEHIYDYKVINKEGALEDAINEVATIIEKELNK